MRAKTVSYLKFFIGWPLSLIALFFITRLILQKGQSIFPKIHEVNFQVLIYAIFFFVVYFFLRSLTWREILKYKGHPLTIKETVFLWGFAEIKRYIPGNIWGILGRAVSFADKKIEGKSILSGLVVEAQLVVLSSLLICSVFLPFIFESFVPFFSSNTFLITVIRIIIYALAIIFVFNQKILSIKILEKTKIANRASRILFSGFSVRENINLIILSLSSFLAFGLGSYFSIVSIYYLNPNYVFLYIGVFLFSFLVGYLSLLTPTGLGVREAALIIGLSKTFDLGLASVAAIFSRVAVIFSELIFLFFAYIWRNTKDRYFLKFETIVRKNIHFSVLILLIVFYIIFFINLSFLRYDNFYTGRFDLGNMDQVVWNSARGKIFQLTDPNGTQISSRLAYHADFILILLSPFYFYWSDPRMLLIIQTVVLALGAIFVYKIAELEIKNHNLSILLSIGYLFNPSLQYSNLYDFHPVALATTLLLGAFYFLKIKRYIFFLIFLILACLTKENVWLTASFFGVYMIVQSLQKLKIDRKEIKKQLLKIISGLILFFLAVFVFYYLVWQAIPNARGGNHFALAYYSDFGTTPAEIVKYLFNHPQKIFKMLSENGRLEYLKQIFLPVGFLPLFSLAILFALPDLLINILSNNTQLHQIYYHYTSVITPFLFIATILGIKNIKKKFPSLPFSIISIYLFLTILFSAYTFGPMPGSRNPNTMMLTSPLKNKNEINQVLSRIKRNEKIAATNNLGSHLSRRPKIYTIPVGLDKANIVAFLLNDPSAQPSLEAQKEMVSKLKKNPKYRIVYEIDDFIVFQKIVKKR